MSEAPNWRRTRRLREQRILGELAEKRLTYVGRCWKSLGADEMLRPSRSELCRKREARTMVCRFAPWLINQLSVAMSDRLGIRMTDEQKQRIHESMQEMIEDVLTDHGMRPVTKIAGAPLVIVAASADVGPVARPCHGALVQAGA